MLTVNLHNNKKYTLATRLNNSQKSVKEMYTLMVSSLNGRLTNSITNLCIQHFYPNPLYVGKKKAIKITN